MRNIRRIIKIGNSLIAMVNKKITGLTSNTTANHKILIQIGISSFSKKNFKIIVHSTEFYLIDVPSKWLFNCEPTVSVRHTNPFVTKNYAFLQSMIWDDSGMPPKN